MQFEPDKISSYYNSSSKPSFFFYRASVIVSMVALLGVLGVNLYTLNQTTSTTSQAAEPTPTPNTTLATPTVSNAANAPIQESTSINEQALPPLPPQCHYESGSQTASGGASTSTNVIKCTEGGKSCTYTIVDNKYQMECN